MTPAKALEKTRRIAYPWVWHLLYVLALVAAALSLPAEAWTRLDSGLLLPIGIIGLWRYGWGLLHFLRAQIYRRWVFPRMRRAADQIGTTEPPPEAFLLVTSFRIDSATCGRVYHATFEAAKHSGCPTTVVASIVEMADQRLIKQIYARTVSPQDQIRLIFVRIAGTGKRDALAYAFRAISLQRPDPDAVVAVIDGDSIVPADLIVKSAGFFRMMPQVGALTTDEDCQVEGRRIFREWYSLRFAQRQILMCSMGLSKRVLTLTGRMSLFRASIICDPTFIAQVEMDYIDHWRLGRIRFLTGDDKSTWFWLLKNGYQMIYLPDITVTTVEQPPSEHFVTAASMLMIRWFGNMLRTNARALRLGPRRIGLFVWWSVLDQRVSMWTCLTGVVIALLATLFVTPVAALLYALWIAGSRYVLTLLLLSVRPQVSLYYPALLYFNQVFGSIIKVYVFFRLDRQKWTRQKTTSQRTVSAFRARFDAAFSGYMQLLCVGLFVYTLAVMIGVLDLPFQPSAIEAGWGHNPVTPVALSH
ncbi:MAG: glycosyltransferase family 2 protein [Candidatus Competibacteraceae bacterium]|nr:glycosyltransferase family 2 protein [Candidatus Competibacteraceae bacterium]